MFHWIYFSRSYSLVWWRSPLSKRLQYLNLKQINHSMWQRLTTMDNHQTCNWSLIFKTVIRHWLLPLLRPRSQWANKWPMLLGDRCRDGLDYKIRHDIKISTYLFAKFSITYHLNLKPVFLLKLNHVINLKVNIYLFYWFYTYKKYVYV